MNLSKRHLSEPVCVESNYKMPPMCDPIVQKETGRKCIFSRKFQTTGSVFMRCPYQVILLALLLLNEAIKVHSEEFTMGWIVLTRLPVGLLVGINCHYYSNKVQQGKLCYNSSWRSRRSNCVSHDLTQCVFGGVCEIELETSCLEHF